MSNLTTNPDIIVRNVCSAIGGQMSGYVCRAPAPNKARTNRSMVIMPSEKASGGITVHLHNAPDDLQTCLELKDEWRERGLIPDTREKRRTTRRPSYTITQRNEAELKAQQESDKAKRREQARAIWSNTVTAQDTLAHEYLGVTRGLCLGAMPEQLRFHPELDYWHCGERLFTSGAMVAKVTDCLTGRGIGVHSTYLNEQAQKHPDAPNGNARKMRGIVKGGCVRLGAFEGVRGVAEGIESALAFTELWGVPCDAALSADGMANYTPPISCEGLLICHDNDASGVGQKAAATLAKRLVAQGLECAFKPSPSGSDWNDFLMGART